MRPSPKICNKTLRSDKLPDSIKNCQKSDDHAVLFTDLTKKIMTEDKFIIKSTKISYLPFIHAISLMIFSIFQILYIGKLILYV